MNGIGAYHNTYFNKHITMKIYYDRLSRTLHWFMAIVIIYATVAGYMMHLTIENYPAVFQFLSILNMSMATLITPLFLVRWWWRYLRAPIPAEQVPHHNVAKMVHSIIYFMMFCVLFSGFLMLQHEYSFFWLYTVPNPISSKEINEFFFIAHRICCILLAILVILHASAALYHHYVRHNRILYRMLGPKSGG